MNALPSPSSWNLDPTVPIAGILLLVGYYLAITRLGPRYSNEPVSRRRVAYYILGVVSLVLTVSSPLDTLGRYYLLSAHTLQLFILITITAPLLLMGLPEWLVTRLLPWRSLRDATRGMLFPVLAALLFNGIIFLWHDAPLYEQALRNTEIHNLQMLCFLIAGILTWWPVLTPMDRHTRMSTPFQMLYLGLESLPLDIFGVIMIFSGTIFYSSYAAAPRIFGLAPMVDQQIAGGILAVPGNLLDVVLFSIVFFTWLEHQEREQRARESELYAKEDTAAQADPGEGGEDTASRDPGVGVTGSASEALPG
ncbi:MAG: cytochrome c oxidase assembly protein [Ktedonobacterales bacterium]